MLATARRRDAPRCSTDWITTACARRNGVTFREIRFLDYGNLRMKPRWEEIRPASAGNGSALSTTNLIQAMKLPIILLAAVAAPTLTRAQSFIAIDSFTGGSSFLLSNANGTANHNYITGESSILGGARQVRVRASSSGFFGSSNIKIDTTAGTMTSFGGDSGDRTLQYGSTIGSDPFTGAGTVAPVNLNLDLNLADAIQFDVAANPASASAQMTLFVNGSSLRFDGPTVNLVGLGTYSVSLSQFPGLTESNANDIDGILFRFPSVTANVASGLVVGELRLAISAVPEPGEYAAAFGLGLAGFAAWRRRSHKVAIVTKQAV